MNICRLRAFLLASFVAVGPAADAVSPSDLRYETVNGLSWSYVVEGGKAKVTNWNMNPAVASSTTGAVIVPDTLGGFPVTAIGSYAFYKIPGITSLTIPEGVDTIEFYACLHCTGLQTVSLPSTLKTMGNAVFSGCENLRAGSIPDSVTSMGRDTFWGCKAMTSVKFSANVDSLGAMTCYNCDSLTEVEIPDGVTYIGVSAFSSCDSLRTIDIPVTVTDIDNYAFSNCPKLEGLVLPEGMTAIRSIFASCSSLATIEIPSTVTAIEGSTFSGCTNMTNIAVVVGNAAYKSVDGALYDITGENLVAWPRGLAAPASIPSGVKRIGDCAFSGRRDLTAIEIPEGVEHIGVSAFDMCVNLASANLPSTIRTIGERAFCCCSLISHAEFYDGFESVGEKAFSRTGVASLTFPASTAVIGPSAFKECASLQSLDVLSPTCRIESYAFADCPRLASVNIAEGAGVSGNAFGDPPEPEPDDPPVVPGNTSIYTNCFAVENGHYPTLVYTSNRAVRFELRSWGANGWFVVQACQRGKAYIANVPIGEAVRDSQFAFQSTSLDSSALNPPQIFRFAFMWTQTLESGSTMRLYGWVSLTTNSAGELCVLACEVADLHGLPVVGRGEPGGGKPPDPVEPEDELLPSDVQDKDVLLQFDCASRYDRDNIYTIQGMDGHYIHSGDMRGETRTDFMGRSCVWLHTYKQCMTGWFSINQTGYYEKSVFENSYPQIFTSVGDCQVPELFETVGTAFRLFSTAPCSAIQSPETKLPIFGTIWEYELYELSESLPRLPEEGLGTMIHVDDKMWLRYSEYDDGGVCKTNWQACAGFVDASSNLVERVVELRSADEGRALPAPINRWTAVRVEAENDASPFGLALRVWIGGVPVATVEDARTVFRARPSASDRNGIAAFGIGGEAYLDDITFYAKARNPFDGVDVNAAGGCLTEIELKTLAAMTGVDVLAGIRRLELNGCDGEPYDAALTCIRLGITPKAVERTPDGECARLYFQNPTVTIIGADFSARTITGRVVAAEGTAVAAPPMPYMFGLTEIYNLGTDYEGRNEYGNAFSHGADGFTLDLSDYMKSNGVFTLCFPEWVAPGGKPAFFRVELKEYGHK